MGGVCSGCEGNTVVYQVPTLTLKLAPREVLLWLTKHNLLFHRRLYNGGTDANYTLVGIPNYWSAAAQRKVLRSVTNRPAFFAVWTRKIKREPSADELERIFCPLV